jgi:hypothetical protein
MNGRFNRFGVAFQQGQRAQACDYTLVTIFRRRSRSARCSCCPRKVSPGALYGMDSRRVRAFCLDCLDPVIVDRPRHRGENVPSDIDALLQAVGA